MGTQRALRDVTTSNARGLPLQQWLACATIALLFTGRAWAETPPVTPAAAIKLEHDALDLYLGRGVPVDYAAAARKFAVAAQAGRPLAQLMLGNQLRAGTGVAVDLPRALQWYRAAGNQGLAAAQTALAWMYLNAAGTRGDLAEATRWLLAAARQDDPRALLMLSNLYAEGIGVTADPELARALLKRSAELGDAAGCRQLGWSLLYGPSAQRNLTQGVQLLRKAAAKQDNQAAFALGWWYLSNDAQYRELSAAAQWMRTAANADNVLARLWLSQMYHRGLGVPRDAIKARELLEHTLVLAEPELKSQFAWDLAVNPDAALRDGPLAVRVMRAMVVASTAPNASHLDTLAAAHAEAGEFDQAIRAEQHALAVLPPTQSELRSAMRQRLQSYRNRQPFREPQQ
jgi:TPR repeat protein